MLEPIRLRAGGIQRGCANWPACVPRLVRISSARRPCRRCALHADNRPVCRSPIRIAPVQAYLFRGPMQAHGIVHAVNDFSGASAASTQELGAVGAADDMGDDSSQSDAEELYIIGPILPCSSTAEGVRPAAAAQLPTASAQSDQHANGATNGRACADQGSNGTADSGGDAPERAGSAAGTLMATIYESSNEGGSATPTGSMDESDSDNESSKTKDEERESAACGSSATAEDGPAAAAEMAVVDGAAAVVLPAADELVGVACADAGGVAEETGSSSSSNGAVVASTSAGTMPITPSGETTATSHSSSSGASEHQPAPHGADEEDNTSGERSRGPSNTPHPQNHKTWHMGTVPPHWWEDVGQAALKWAIAGAVAAFVLPAALGVGRPKRGTSPYSGWQYSLSSTPAEAVAEAASWNMAGAGSGGGYSMAAQFGDESLLEGIQDWLVGRWALLLSACWVDLQACACRVMGGYGGTSGCSKMNTVALHPVVASVLEKEHLTGAHVDMLLAQCCNRKHRGYSHCLNFQSQGLKASPASALHPVPHCPGHGASSVHHPAHSYHLSFPRLPSVQDCLLSAAAEHVPCAGKNPGARGLWRAYHISGGSGLPAGLRNDLWGVPL